MEDNTWRRKKPLQVKARPTKGHRHSHVTSSLVQCNGNLTRARFESRVGLTGTVSVQYNTTNNQQSLGVADAIEASDMVLVILRDDHRHTSFGHHGYDRQKVKKSVCGTYIRKTPFLLFVLFHAFSCFFMLFTKKVEKSRKSQVPYLPECFPRWWKK